MIATPAGRPLINLDGVCRNYGSGAGTCMALRRVNLQLRRGSFTALAGPSGSGKTTLLNIMGGIDSPTSGRVSIADLNLDGMKDAERAALRLREIGFIFQQIHLIPVLSVAENVEFPLLFRRELGAAERKRRTESAIHRVGLGDRKIRRPHELSGGEQQRVALARALAGEPAIVLADEPTANLDQETGLGVLQLMRSINREHGTTFFYATHDARLVALADTVVKLRNGLLEMEAAA